MSAIDGYVEFCTNRYYEIFNTEMQARRSTKEAERVAQKKAIRDTTLEALRQYGHIDPAEIWKTVYSLHVQRKSGLTATPEVVEKVISADNSWKKSSGHAFEEMIPLFFNHGLQGYGIQIILQKELSRLFQIGGIHNEQRDLEWLRSQLNSSVFDLYVTVTRDNRTNVFGCVQSKTSIRERATRDREPSIHAMQHFFWSIAIVLDGEYLAMPKFKHMVNGGSVDYPENGWHGLYVLDKENRTETNPLAVDRIYTLDVDLDLFVDHARKAADHWLSQRQWFNHNWKA